MALALASGRTTPRWRGHKFIVTEIGPALKITIVGGGYVGLVTAAGFAEMGNHVVCSRRIGKLHMLESASPDPRPGWSDHPGNSRRAGSPSRHRSRKRLRIASSFHRGGYSTQDDGSPDMSFVYSAAKQVGEAISAMPVATKSTVPIGTADKIGDSRRGGPKARR